ncbi:Uncharacterised protein [Delftia tsuruhatensis]|uniref:hypothetical protein n=1 Tax=Delftia tsuruhatensis TaxID=180282 RepID=UPI001E6C148A|nr:hypothetical protein [Delftia tsuruhatensis]CAB5722426.1 Uncharacterised protein [Delftia tsuruhatensis]CAC9682429.1 Uncharacterised protein [Delftia tsuruhatensis]
MLHSNITEQVGHYVLTPLTQANGRGQVAAAVSIRRGAYDRIFRFIPQFADEALASRFALAQGRILVQDRQLG